MSIHLTAGGLQSLNAMNQRVYAMSEEDRERWYAEHPVEMDEAAAALYADDDDSGALASGGAA